MTIDPITLEVVRNALASTADEMALVVMRSAYSPVVRDTMDYSTALCDRDGRIVAQGLTLAVQLGTFPTLMRHVLDETARPGDVFVANDPYGYGGQHLPDIYVIKPIFVAGELEGWAATMAHHADVGGIAPGSIAVHATEIFQEGLRLPLLKLHDEGVANETLLRIIEKNTRQPTQVLGDLNAQVAACRAGERGLVQLVERYGDETVRPTSSACRSSPSDDAPGDRGAAGRRVRLRRLVDGFGDDPEPIGIQVSVAIRGDEIEIDFTGTSEQVDASLNCPVGMVSAACYCAIRGIVRARHPELRGVHAPDPGARARGHRGEPGAARRLRRARGDRLPGLRRADGRARAGRARARGRRRRGWADADRLRRLRRARRAFVTTEVIVGAWGARATLDGLEGVSNPLANLSNQPVELLESDLPLEVLRYGLVCDSGGAGEHRGGLAYEREYRVRTERATLTIRSDRRFHPPYGLEGGSPGRPSRNTIVDDGGADVPPMPMAALDARRGDRFRHRSAGGGGFGSPLDRDPGRCSPTWSPGR